MPNLDQDSLFSLELVVERISLSKSTVCRLPAVAFRLLDFPTLIIHHVDIHLAEMLRSRINTDPYYKLPTKFPEFLDIEGNFRVQKGKSCLFKISPNTFHAHLSSAPLYIMVMDTYPKVPKLIGSCSVPLDGLMNELYDEICQHGTSIPLVNGEKGSSEIFNLMGIKLGSIDISYRILSLGGALLRHIPENMVSQIKSTDGNILQPPSEDFWRAAVVQEVPGTQEADKDRDERKTNAVPVAASLRQDTKTQTDEVRFGNVEVQTVSKKTRRTRIVHTLSPVESNDLDDLIETETLCPPPLYYNSDADVGAAVSLFRKRQAWIEHHVNSCSDDVSEDGTIRPEDKFSEFDDLPRKSHPGRAQSQTPKKVHVQSDASKFGNHRSPAGIRPMTQFSQFPVLQALIAEIMQLQGFPTAAEFGRAPLVQRGRERYLQKTTSSDSDRKVTVQRVSSKSEKFNYGRVSHQVGTPEIKTIQQREKQMRGQVSRETLVPGSTKSQRLRLLKHNPKLLKATEAKEEERIAKWKQQNAQRKQAKDSASKDSLQDSVRDILPRAGYFIETSDVGVDVDMVSNHQHSHRPPVPTPRSTLLAAQKQSLYDNKYDGSTSEQHISSEIAGSGLRNMKVLEKDIVETFVKPFVGNNHQQALKDMRQTALIPGFGETRTMALNFGKERLAEEVSDDKILKSTAEGLRSDLIGDEPELRKIVDHYSYDFDRSAETSLDAEFQLCEEPNLQKIIDHRSDDSDEGNSLAHHGVAENKKTNMNSNKTDSSYQPQTSDLVQPVTSSGKSASLRKGSPRLEDRALSGRTPRSKTGRLDYLRQSTSQDLSEILSSTSIGLETISDGPESQSDEEESYRLKYMETKDIRLKPDSKLGYTWN